MDKKAEILAEYDKKHTIYEGFAKKTEQLLREIIGGECIAYNAITSRAKDRDNLAKKLDRKQGKYNCLSDITDVAGVRVITFYSDDVDRVAGIVEKEFVVDRENSIDKRKALEPDRFGYCSVHYIVSLGEERLKLSEYKPYEGLKCEIQIRTVLQHAWAEIEHKLGYKSGVELPPSLRRKFSRLAGLLELGDDEFSDLRRRINEYREEVKGKIAEEEFVDSELDSIILEEFIKTDSDVAALNSEMERVFNKKIAGSDFKYGLERIISKLKWLDVKTLAQLKKTVADDREIAVKIADKVVNDGTRKPREGSRIDNTIGLFYICYAELLLQCRGFEAVKKFSDELKINLSDGFIDKLLDIQKQLNL